MALFGSFFSVIPANAGIQVFLILNLDPGFPYRGTGQALPGIPVKRECQADCIFGMNCSGSKLLLSRIMTNMVRTIFRAMMTRDST